MKPKQPAGPAMTLANMRELGVQNLIASCLNDACRHTALINVFSYPAETEILTSKAVWSAPSAAAGTTRSTLGRIGKSNRRSRVSQARCGDDGLAGHW
jgi:hypothetical protein